MAANLIPAAALLLTRPCRSTSNCILPAGKIGRIVDACADAWFVDFGLLVLVRVPFNCNLVRLVQVNTQGAYRETP